MQRCVQENVEHSVHRGEQFKEAFPYLTFDDSVIHLASWLLVLQQNKKEIVPQNAEIFSKI